MKNKNAFGTCYNCNNQEHFVCAGTKSELREEIKENLSNFYCTNCFEENPQLGKNIEQNVPRSITAQVVLPIEVHEDPDAITVIETDVIVETRNMEINQGKLLSIQELFKCDGCSYDCEDGDTLRMHIQDQHNAKERECKECNTKFTDEDELSSHVTNQQKKAIPK